MITVKVTGNPSKALKILKRLVNEEGTFNTLRERKYFTKKGEKRRLKKERAKARIRKRNEKLLEGYIKNY
jgi:ribosomal protein S21